MTASQPSASTYTALSKYLDMMRLTLFEIVTQFRAVFGDASSNVRNYSPEYVLEICHYFRFQDPSRDVLNIWAFSRINSIIALLEQYDF
jgi:hypothetical protein